MFIILIIVSFFVLLAFPFARYFVLHPVTCVKGACVDIYTYFHHKKANICPYYGQIYMFVGSGSKAFGSGKTLSMIDWLRTVYHKYNGLKVWDEEKQEFVTQHIIIISNIELKDIPYIPFMGKSQFIDIDKIEKGNMDVVLFAIDEASTEFNSRSYQTNFSTDFLCRLLQVRKNRCGLILTAQRFQFTDKLLRNVTGVVTTCMKKWRIVRLQEYDAFSLENAQNPAMIQPITTRFYYATDKLYNSYDTTYTVEKLKDQLSSGDLLTTNEYLANIRSDGNIDNVKNRWRRAYRRNK